MSADRESGAVAERYTRRGDPGRYSPLRPDVWQTLQERGFHLVEVPPEEFASMGCNVLATAPAQCIMLDGNPITRERLEKAGCRVQTFTGNEVSFKAEGGPTCLTRPVWRE